MSSETTAVGARIRTLRERAGLQSRELADAVGLDPSAMSNIERGKRGVKAHELSLIADALRVSPMAILDESSLLARLPVAPREDHGDRSGASAFDRLTALAELHDVLTHEGIEAEPQLGDVPAIDIGDWKTSADQLAEWAQSRLEVGHLGDDRFEALADAIEERFQVDVLIEDHPDGSIAGAAITDRSFPLIYLRASQPRPRALFTLAHELAHVLASDGEVITLDGDLTARTDRERFANAFAAAFLMPAGAVRAVIAEEGITAQALAKLVTTLGVSYESLVYRLHNLGYTNFQGRNNLRSVGLRGVLSKLEDEVLESQILARLADSGGVPVRVPRWLAHRALAGYRSGIVSARPLAALLGLEVEDVLDALEEPNLMVPGVDATAGADSLDEAERYSGSPVV